MSFVPVSARLLRPTGSALPWDLFDRNGLLFAAKGTPMQACTALFADTDRVFYLEERQAKAAQAALGKLNAEDMANLTPSIVDALEDADQVARFIDVPKDSPVLAQLESWALKLRSLFATPEASSTWGYRMYRVGQALAGFLSQHAQHLQLVLAVRSPYETVGYAGWHPMFRACLAYRAAQLWGATDYELEMLVCSALAADVSMYRLSEELAGRREPLTEAQRQVVDKHPLESTSLLRKASVVDPLWLYLTERHHQAPATPVSEQSARRHVLQEILRIADIITARASLRRDRPALPLMTALAQATVDTATRQVSYVAKYFVSAMGVPPTGALVTTSDNAFAVVLKTQRIVLLTDGMQIPKPDFSTRNLTAQEFKQLKPVAPGSVARLKILLEKLLTEVSV